MGHSRRYEGRQASFPYTTVLMWCRVRAAVTVRGLEKGTELSVFWGCISAELAGTICRARVCYEVLVPRGGRMELLTEMEGCGRRGLDRELQWVLGTTF